MAFGDKLNDLTNPNSVYTRVKKLEADARKARGHAGDGHTQDGGGVGNNTVAIVDIADVTATVVPAYDSSHNFRPYIHVAIGGTYETARSFIGYTLRVFPAIGAAFEHDGPEFPAAGSPIDVHNLPTPPQNTETWHVQVRVRTGLYGPGFWSDFVPVSYGGDVVAPLAPTWAGGTAWVLDNSYNWGAHESSVSVTCLAGLPLDQDLNAFIFSFSTDGGTTWTDIPPVVWTEPIGIFRHLTPGATIKIRAFAEDTSGNRSPASAVQTLLVASIGPPSAPNGFAAGAYDFDPDTQSDIVPLGWTAPPGYTGQLSAYRLYLTVNGILNVYDNGLNLTYNLEVPQGGTWSASCSAIDLYGQEGTIAGPVSGTAPIWVVPSLVPNGSFEMPANGRPTRAYGWTPISSFSNSVTRVTGSPGGRVWDGQWGMEFVVAGGFGNNAAISSLHAAMAAPPATLGIPDQYSGTWVIVYAFKSNIAITGALNIIASYYDGAGTLLGTENVAMGVNCATAWTMQANNLGAVTPIPAGTQSVTFLIQVANPSIAITINVDAFRFYRNIQGYQIAPKAIQPSNLNDGAVIPSKLDLGTGLFLNGSMELPNTSGTFPDGWTFTGTAVWVNDPGGTITGDGVRCVQLGGTAAGTHTLESPKMHWTSAASANRYFLRARWRTLQSSLNAGTGDTWKVELVSYDASGAQLAAITLVDDYGLGFPTLTILQQYQSGSGTVPAAVKYVSLRFTLVSAGTHAISVDSVELINSTVPHASSRYELRGPGGNSILSQYTGGSSNPSASLSGDKQLRTDLLGESIFDGTNWLGPEYEKAGWSYYTTFNTGASTAAEITATEEYQYCALRQDQALRLWRWELFGFVNGINNNATDFWQITMRTFPGLVVLKVVDTKLWAPTTWSQVVATTTFTAQPATTDFGIEIFVKKTGSPGNLRFAHGLWVRNIIT